MTFHITYYSFFVAAALSVSLNCRLHYRDHISKLTLYALRYLLFYPYTVGITARPVFWKAVSAIEVTVVGIVISLSEVQP